VKENPDENVETLQPVLRRHSATFEEELDRPGNDGDVDADRADRSDVRRRRLDGGRRVDERGVLLGEVFFHRLQFERSLLRKSGDDDETIFFFVANDAAAK
jgi:hypothetical protein